MQLRDNRVLRGGGGAEEGGRGAHAGLGGPGLVVPAVQLAGSVAPFDEALGDLLDVARGGQLSDQREDLLVDLDALD